MKLILNLLFLSTLSNCEKSSNNKNAPILTDPTTAQSKASITIQQEDDSATQQEDDSATQQEDDSATQQEDDTAIQQEDDSAIQQEDDSATQQEDDSATQEVATTIKNTTEEIPSKLNIKWISVLTSMKNYSDFSNNCCFIPNTESVYEKYNGSKSNPHVYYNYDEKCYIFVVSNTDNYKRFRVVPCNNIEQCHDFFDYKSEKYDTGNWYLPKIEKNSIFKDSEHEEVFNEETLKIKVSWDK